MKELEEQLDKILWVPGLGQEAQYKSMRKQLVDLYTLLITKARINELLKMPIRTMDDPDDDTNVFWYRTYTMPEYEARLAELNATTQK